MTDKKLLLKAIKCIPENFLGEEARIAVFKQEGMKAVIVARPDIQPVIFTMELGWRNLNI